TQVGNEGREVTLRRAERRADCADALRDRGRQCHESIGRRVNGRQERSPKVFLEVAERDGRLLASGRSRGSSATDLRLNLTKDDLLSLEGVPRLDHRLDLFLLLLGERHAGARESRD